MNNDLLPKNLTGYWNQFDSRDLYWIKSIGELGIDHVYFALDMPQRAGIYSRLDELPRDQPLIISFHVEYFWQHDLLRWFRSRPNQKILLLSDWHTYDNFWPSNVTVCRWITWHHQLARIINTYGMCRPRTEPPSRKFSSLAGRHEWHRAAITALLLSRLPPQDLVLSWQDIRFDKNLYYLRDDQYLDPMIAKLVRSEWFRNLAPIHSLVNRGSGSPLDHANWNHPAYLDCAVNFTNESIFNSCTMIDQKFFHLPGPYLTEKTWKPLLACQAFVPVGQRGTVNTLEDLGLRFTWLRRLNFSEQPADQDRMVAIMRFVLSIKDIECDDLWALSQPDAQANLDWIHSGEFARQCDQANQSVLHQIDQWLVDGAQ